ncbi:LacI family DNA-binding transcriptional regulator [Pseudonocardia nematodicida]|uniref:LacI family DNA-binding transcriptional regulator n=1 Tax=Pseudonocardia nematodicida TaxID=1206997 RepID=A0ABV1KBV7_9PSEU
MPDRSGRGDRRAVPTSARATIYDIAAEAGVSSATVSRTFGAPAKVRPDTRRRVLDVAARLGYRANPLARALPSGRTSTLALVVPAITNPHFFDIITGAEQRAVEAGFTLVLANTGQSDLSEAAAIERLEPMVDGVMLASSRLDDDRIARFADRTNLALCNRQAGRIPSVTTDQVNGIEQVVGHLHSLGHRRIGLLGGPETSWAGRLRRRAVVAAGGRLGVTVQLLGPFNPIVAGGQSAADAAIGAGVTAVLAHNDLLAIGVLRRLADRGVHVPGEMSVVGFDDIFGADFCVPALTTVAAPSHELGRTAVDLVLASVAGQPVPASTVLPAHLTVRESTGPAPDSRTAPGQSRWRTQSAQTLPPGSR